jgi:hypothetical protein
LRKTRRAGRALLLAQCATRWPASYTQPRTQSWTVLAVDRAGNSSGPSNAMTLTVVADQNLC